MFLRDAEQTVCLCQIDTDVFHGAQDNGDENMARLSKLVSAWVPFIFLVCTDGPDETEIVGPSVFITFNGTQTLTLTCNTTVIPTPDYQWLGKDCENGNTENTCRYTPNTTDDGKSVVCAASNRKFSPWKIVRSDPYYFNLLYPPQASPEITTSSTSDPILWAGDLLTCTVTGGKPLVSKITFFCDTPHHQDQDDARSHPPPKMFLVKRTDNDLQVLIGQEREATYERTLVYIISELTCEDMGIYTCFADNGIAPQDKKALQLNVFCSPRPTEDSFSITRLNHTELTKEGLSFTVLAYPVPGSFAYFHYASTVDVNRNPVGNQDMFETEFSSMAESSTANTAAVAGGVAGGMVVLAIVIVGAVFAWRRRYLRYERPIPRRSQNPHLYTDLQQGNGQQPSLNPNYANSQELSDQLQTSVNYANTEPRPDLSQKSDLDTYINVETRNTYEHIEAQPQAVSNVYNARHSPNQTAGVENIP
ncbi:hypothetical protein BaRGS_00030419 [Batillaria attramentaria]|uniref:Ig-like domain-containing protein n=1 Tax=Batillaria attramentaria TaxID=370345 RepID=A0ABD0JUJ4_9CAEN